MGGFFYFLLNFLVRYISLSIWDVYIYMYVCGISMDFLMFMGCFYFFSKKHHQVLVPMTVQRVQPPI